MKNMRRREDLRSASQSNINKNERRREEKGQYYRGIPKEGSRSDDEDDE